MTDLEILAELIKQERDGYGMDFELTGHKLAYGRGYVAALDRAAEIIKEFIEEVN